MKTTKLLDVNFKYVSSSKTNVLDTLRRLGFEPPSEDIRFQKKWHKIRNSAAIHEGLKK